MQTQTQTQTDDIPVTKELIKKLEDIGRCDLVAMACDAIIENITIIVKKQAAVFENHN